MYQIHYNKIWGRLYITIGILTGIIFITGGFTLNDWTIYGYLLASFYIIAIGYSMLKKHYVTYDFIEIRIYGHFGMLRKVYHFDGPNDILVKNNRLYCNGKKLRLNDWLVDKQDWERMKNFYSEKDEVLMQELQND